MNDFTKIGELNDPCELFYSRIISKEKQEFLIKHLQEQINSLYLPQTYNVSKKEILIILESIHFLLCALKIKEVDIN